MSLFGKLLCRLEINFICHLVIITDYQCKLHFFRKKLGLLKDYPVHPLHQRRSQTEINLQKQGFNLAFILIEPSPDATKLNVLDTYVYCCELTIMTFYGHCGVSLLY